MFPVPLTKLIFLKGNQTYTFRPLDFRPHVDIQHAFAQRDHASGENDQPFGHKSLTRAASLEAIVDADPSLLIQNGLFEHVLWAYAPLRISNSPRSASRKPQSLEGRPGGNHIPADTTCSALATTVASPKNPHGISRSGLVRETQVAKGIHGRYISFDLCDRQCPDWLGVIPNPINIAENAGSQLHF